MSAPKMPEIRQAITAARALDGREDTEEFVLQVPGLLARLVQYLDLYVGKEPTLAEEEAYVRQQHRAETLAEAATVADEIAAAMKSADESWASRAGWACATVAVRLRGMAGGSRVSEPARPAPRARVLTQAFTGAPPHLTIRLEFGPEYTTDGIQAITDRVRVASRHGLVEVTEGGEPRG